MIAQLMKKCDTFSRHTDDLKGVTKKNSLNTSKAWPLFNVKMLK